MVKIIKETILRLVDEKHIVISILVILGLIVIIDLSSPRGNSSGSPEVKSITTVSATTTPAESVELKEVQKPKQEDEIKVAIGQYLTKEYELTEKENTALDVIPSASVFMTKLGNKELYDEIIKVSKQLMTILAEKETAKIPSGYEKSHEYSIKATQAYVEYARTLADGIYYSDTQKIKDATGKLREANGYLDLSSALMPKKNSQ